MTSSIFDGDFHSHSRSLKILANVFVLCRLRQLLHVERKNVVQFDFGSILLFVFDHFDELLLVVENNFIHFRLLPLLNVVTERIGDSAALE